MTGRFEGRSILIGITGGIAAYKACDLIRELYRQGAKRVEAVMTSSACEFITPLTIESLTQAPVHTQHLQNTVDGIPNHIAFAQQFDAFLILPASANTIAQLAHGMADNIVSTTALTFTGQPIVIAPAMNTRMWENPLVQENLERLRRIPEITMIPPESGLLACGETGDGKLADLETILLMLYRACHPNRHALAGKRALVSAGGTREPLDAVRVLTNRSSGKMGVALADELFALGATVTLVHTGEAVKKPYETFAVQTVHQMSQVMKGCFPNADITWMTAAVSDYIYPDSLSNQKMKKQAQWHLTLTQSEDILAALGQSKRPDQILVGFAAEADPEKMTQFAQEKMQRKHLDWMVLNDVSRSDIGFGTDDNAVKLFSAQAKTQHVFEKQPKWKIARQLIQTIVLSQDSIIPKLSEYLTEPVK